MLKEFRENIDNFSRKPKNQMEIPNLKKKIHRKEAFNELHTLKKKMIELEDRLDVNIHIEARKEKRNFTERNTYTSS